MPRPPLPVGSHGRITVTVSASGNHVARASYRDQDGVTRLVERAGRTPSLARNKLLAALQQRSGPNSRTDLTAESTFRQAAELWLGTVEAAADTGDLSPDAGTVEVDYKLVRIAGEGLRRVRRLKAGEGRTLLLPPFAVAMLRRRCLGPSPHAPVFPDTVGGWRDPSNTSRDFREAWHAVGFSWVTSHVFRKTCATIPQDVYMGRKIANPHAAAALEAAAVTRAAE